MQIIVKQLKGGECSVEVLPNTRIYEIKREVQEKLGIPMEEQKLLLLGRTLVDEQTVDAYPSINDGTKLNLIVRKPEGFYEVSVRHFQKMGMNSNEALCAASRLTRTIQDKFNELSWDDIDRLSLDCLLDEDTRPPIESEADADDMFNL